MFKLNSNIKNLKEENEILKSKVAEKEEICATLNEKLATAIKSAKKYEEVQNQLYLAELKIKVICF